MSSNHLATLRQTRKISDHTIEVFRIQPNGAGWLYPVPGFARPIRWKAFNSDASPKYLWDWTGPDGKKHKPPEAKYYHAPDLVDAIEAAGGVLWIAGGEPDLWVLHSVGIHNAICWFGETAIPADLMADLMAWGVRVVRYAPDRDKTGQDAASKLLSMLAGTDITLIVHQLPGDPDSHNDIGKCWLDFDGDGPQFAAWLENLPTQTVKLPTATIARSYGSVSARDVTPTGDIDNDRQARYIQAAVDGIAAEIANSATGERNRALYSRARRLGTFVGADLLAEAEARAVLQRAGETCGLAPREIAATINSGINKGKTEPPQLPGFETTKTASTCAPRQTPTANQTGYFPHGLPYTLNKRLLNAHRLLDGQVYKQDPLALFLLILDELFGSLPGEFSAGDFKAATESIEIIDGKEVLSGRWLTRHTVEAALEQGVAWGFLEVLRKTQPIVDTSQSIGSIFSKTSHSESGTLPGGRPPTLYRVIPLPEALANFERRFIRLLREAGYDNIPADVRADFADLTPEQVADLDADRRAAYDLYISQRDEGDAWLEQQVKYLLADSRRILVGKYRPVTLSPGPLPNTRAFRDALHRETLEAVDGRRENGYKQRRELGVSASTLARIRERNGVITVEREATVAACDVSDYQRRAGLVIDVDQDGNICPAEDGTVRVKLPRAEVFIDKASEEEKMKAKRFSNRQKERARLRRAARPQDAPFGLDDVTPKSPHSKKSLTIPATYSDQWLMRQFEFCASSSQIPRVDPVTGEVYTPTQLWQMLAKFLAEQNNPRAGP